jgi:hypothetical protein
MIKEPTNDELYAAINNCCISAAFNEENYARPTKESLEKLVTLRSKRTLFFGVDDFIVRSEVDRYIRESEEIK